jgi:hypothetical protein
MSTVSAAAAANSTLKKTAQSFSTSIPAKATRSCPNSPSDTAIDPTSPVRAMARMAVLSAFRNGSANRMTQAATRRISSGMMGIRSGACI